MRGGFERDGSKIKYQLALRARPDFLLARFACSGLVFVETIGFELFFVTILVFAFGVLCFDFVLGAARFRFALTTDNFARAPLVARSELEKYSFIGSIILLPATLLITRLFIWNVGVHEC